MKDEGGFKWWGYMSIEHSKWEGLKEGRATVSLRTEGKATVARVWRPTGWLKYWRDMQGPGHAGASRSR